MVGHDRFCAGKDIPIGPHRVPQCIDRGLLFALGEVMEVTGLNRVFSCCLDTPDLCSLSSVMRRRGVVTAGRWPFTKLGNGFDRLANAGRDGCLNTSRDDRVHEGPHGSVVGWFGDNGAVSCHLAVRLMQQGMSGNQSEKAAHASRRRRGGRHQPSGPSRWVQTGISTRVGPVAIHCVRAVPFSR